jgi:hypothetical protein
MFCSKCGNHGDEREKFCRKCGADLGNASLASVRQNVPPRKSSGEGVAPKDPDELIGNGLASVFAGDGFFLVAVILSATDSAVSSLLWLFLLIPAFFFFGKGFANVFQARQIRRRMKQDELDAGLTAAELSPPQESATAIFKNPSSAELLPASSVTERTTRQLK